MSVWLILSGILAPALFWLGYFTYKDRFQPEPLTRMGTSYMLGIAAALACAHTLRLILPILGLPDDPSALMEGDRLSWLLYSVGITGIVEEMFKFLPFAYIVLRFPSFDELSDGVIYASIIALGFASYENTLYLPYLEGFELFGRAFASPLTHTIFSSIWGYAVGSAHMQGRSQIRAALIGLALAGTCHGLFNFLTTSPELRVLSSILILAVWIWRIRFLERSADRDQPR
ncbi:MAG: PrsW family glutamic-type intramembrane protease [Candidatus Aminicenantaceae bacterium]